MTHDQDDERAAAVMTVQQAVGELLGKACARPDSQAWCEAFIAGKARITITANRLDVTPLAGDGDGADLRVGMYL